jgi:hypothetical protein
MHVQDVARIALPGARVASTSPFLKVDTSAQAMARVARTRPQCSGQRVLSLSVAQETPQKTL